MFALLRPGVLASISNIIAQTLINKKGNRSLSAMYGILDIRQHITRVHITASRQVPDLGVVCIPHPPGSHNRERKSGQESDAKTSVLGTAASSASASAAAPADRAKPAAAKSASSGHKLAQPVPFAPEEERTTSSSLDLRPVPMQKS